MTSETFDWPAEAKRVAAAFGFAGECEFRQFLPGIWLISTPSHHLRAMVGELELKVRYDTRKGHKSFILEAEDAPRSSLRDHLRLNFDGSVIHPPTIFTHANSIAKGLFYLGLLTPEVEEALRVSVSAHEKLEWGLERESDINSQPVE